MGQLSIRTQIILSLNAMILVLGLAGSWVSMHLVTRSIEDRALREPARNAARLMALLRLPVSERLAEDLRSMTGCETAITALPGHEILAASLAPASRDGLAAALDAAHCPARVTLDGQAYALAGADISGRSPSVRVLLLLPVASLSVAGRRAGWRVAWVTLAAIVLTTAAGAWLAHGVTRSLRRLADEAARMVPRLDDTDSGESGPATGPLPGAPLRFAATAAPAEVASLAHSFNEVLGRLQAAQCRLDHAARLAAVGQLAASVVHEVRNPLCGIAMNARILADDAARRGQRDPSLDLIAREVERIDLYLQELLLLAGGSPRRAGLAGAAGESTPADLRAAVDSVAALTAGRRRHTGVVLTQELPAEALAAAIGETPLRQVLLNLVTNALDAMPDGGRIVVRAVRTAAGMLRVELADSGPGLRLPEGMDAFEPFVTSKPGGSGLGLHICRRVIEQSGGRIGFLAGEGGGTVFWFEIPRASA
jgi:signal transduction histidine kinase